MANTLETLEKQFRFLQEEYGFTLEKKLSEEWGSQIEYINKTTNVGVRILYEIREGYIFILLCRLVDGKIVENKRNLNDSTVLNNFSLDDIISLKNPSDIIKAGYEYPDNHEYHDKRDGLKYYTRDFSINLRKHAKDILEGSFVLFPKLDEIVRNRAKKYGQYG